jgi:hypothetical protein
VLDGTRGEGRAATVALDAKHGLVRACSDWSSRFRSVIGHPPTKTHPNPFQPEPFNPAKEPR